MKERRQPAICRVVQERRLPKLTFNFFFALVYLGIMEAHVEARLKHRNTIVLWWPQGFQGSSIGPHDVERRQTLPKILVVFPVLGIKSSAQAGQKKEKTRNRPRQVVPYAWFTGNFFLINKWIFAGQTGRKLTSSVRELGRLSYKNLRPTIGPP